MSEHTNIEWCSSSWNPWHGCRKISPGCKNCYMYRDKARYGQDPTKVVRSKTTFHEPLKWPEPKLIFTCSWSDWLIEEADAWREEAYDIIRRTPQHTYQILTKRIERAEGRVPDPPLPNVWLGVSVENQHYADERIPRLLKTPAAVRFVSYEPALGPVDFTPWIGKTTHCCLRCGWTPIEGMERYAEIHGLEAKCLRCGDTLPNTTLDWIIVGGESGPGARPFDVQNARNTIKQCEAADVACFVKQFGALPIDRAENWLQWRDVGAGVVTRDDDKIRVILRDKKGGDMSEWEPGLRVREYPR